jgi:hypothetical protein
MPSAYDIGYPFAFPALPVVFRQIDGNASTLPLPARVALSTFLIRFGALYCRVFDR